LNENLATRLKFAVIFVTGPQKPEGLLSNLRTVRYEPGNSGRVEFSFHQSDPKNENPNLISTFDFMNISQKSTSKTAETSEYRSIREMCFEKMAQARMHFINR
jgi:hypothetical protein